MTQKTIDLNQDFYSKEDIDLYIDTFLEELLTDLENNLNNEDIDPNN